MISIPVISLNFFSNTLSSGNKLSILNCPLTKNLLNVFDGLFLYISSATTGNSFSENNPSKTFNKFFVNGQLRMESLFPEERVLLKKFSEITGMEIKDMGELDLTKAEEVANEIERLVNTDEFKSLKEVETKEEKSEKKWVCPVCGYIHYGDNPPTVKFFIRLLRYCYTKCLLKNL